jgi:thymidylate synthase
MRQYLDLLDKILKDGTVQASRAVLQSTGERPNTLSTFGLQAEYDLREGFPIVTTKRVPFRQIVVELLWFLSGSTNVKPLVAQGVHIWDQWADADGDLGVTYGNTWRNFYGPGFHQIDQIAGLLHDIRTVIKDPQASAARRLVVTAWNPAEMHRARGPVGCHTMCQFYVQGRNLSCKMYQRSADMFLGVPWNISCYALLTHLVAKATGLMAHRLVHTFGDAHIYENHIDQVVEQLSREPLPLPVLHIDGLFSDLDNLSPEQFRLIGYEHHPALKGEVAV